MRLWRDGTVNDGFIAHFLERVLVKAFLPRDARSASAVLLS